MEGGEEEEDELVSEEAEKDRAREVVVIGGGAARGRRWELGSDTSLLASWRPAPASICARGPLLIKGSSRGGAGEPPVLNSDVCIR